MTDSDPDQADIPQLAVALEGNGPFSIADVGDLFVAISGDYRRLTRGRALVIVDLRTGSIHALFQDVANLGHAAIEGAAPYIKDAVDTAKAAKSIADFVKTLQGLFGQAKAKPGSLKELRGRQAIGVASIRKIAAIAASTQTTIKVDFSAGGQVAGLTVTPADGRQIVEADRRQIAESENPVELQKLTVRPFSGSGPLLPVSHLPPTIDRALERLSLASDSDVAGLVAALADLLRSHNLTAMISDLAGELERKGMTRAAALMRAQTGPSNRLPPLTI